jgi:hypothetical protein
MSPANHNHLHKHTSLTSYSQIQPPSSQHGLTSSAAHILSLSHTGNPAAPALIALPAFLMARIAAVEDKATSQCTQRKDDHRLRDYINFCSSIGISPAHALPALPDLIAAWASSFVGRLSGQTVSAKIGAVKKLHDRLGYPWEGTDRLRRIIKGIEQSRPMSSFRPKCAPVTIAMLLDIDRNLDRSDSRDICI